MRNFCLFSRMNVLITYKEISDFIEQKFKIRPLFSSIDRRTLNVSYKPMAFIPSIDIKFVFKCEMTLSLEVSIVLLNAMRVIM